MTFSRNVLVCRWVGGTSPLVLVNCASVLEREKEDKLGLTLWPVNQKSLKTLICANFDGPIGGLAQHGWSDSVKERHI